MPSSVVAEIGCLQCFDMIGGHHKGHLSVKYQSSHLYRFTEFNVSLSGTAGETLQTWNMAFKAIVCVCGFMTLAE